MRKITKSIGWVMYISGMMLFYILTTGFFLPFTALSLVVIGQKLIDVVEDKL